MKRTKQIILFLLILFSVLNTGCLIPRGLKSDVIVRHPDAPMLIQEVKGSKIKVAIYDASENKMIEFGWIDLGACKCWQGWTIQKFDWQKFIKKKANQ